MPRLPTPPTIPELHKLLAYDPDTGLLTWRVDRGRVRAGDEAGYLTRRDGVLVTLGRHRYPAPQVIAALVNNRWMINTHYVRTIGDRNDLRLSNLSAELRPPESADIIATADADSTSLRRAKLRERQRRYRAKRRAEGPPEPTFPGVQRQANGRWRASVMVASEGEAKLARLLLGDSFRSAAEAEAAVHAHHEVRQYIDAHPPRLTDGMLVRISPAGPTIAMLHQMLCYDPDTGVIYWRDGVRRGLRADQKRPRGGGRYVEHHRHRYRAEVIAWVLAYGKVPRRGSIYWLDDNMSNNRLANLASRYEDHLGGVDV